MPPTTVTLDDKYTARHGRVLTLRDPGARAADPRTTPARHRPRPGHPGLRQRLPGIAAGRTGPGDGTRAAASSTTAGVVFRPGLNEELAATAVAGTQLLRHAPGRRHDGVTGFWYGKNPGLDRAADAIRHGTLAGTTALGGAVALIGDDPASKSSTVPSSCEPMAQSLLLPLLAPGSVAEIVELRAARRRDVARQRTLDRAEDRRRRRRRRRHRGRRGARPRPIWRRAGSHPRRGPGPHARRPGFARRRARRTHPPPRPRPRLRPLGRAQPDRVHRPERPARRARLRHVGSQSCSAPSTTSASTRPAMEALGLRLIRLAMPFPVDADTLAELTDDLDEVLVVEDKVPFLEDHLKAALYGRPHVPRVVGRHDPDGRPLLSARGHARRRGRGRRTRRPHRPRPAPAAPPPSTCGRPRRHHRPGSRCPWPPAPPFFCSGCPHNTSTRTSDDTLVGVGIGCHAMIALDGAGRGHQLGLTQMGGEGAQWLGLAPFTDDRHFVQNLGDGTFHHSGSLAIRAAVAARRDHDVQAALQRRRRDDRWPARRGPARRPRAHPVAGGRGRAPRRRHHRRPRQLPRRRPRPDRARPPPRRVRGRRAGAGRRRRRHRPDPRRPLRRRGAPPAQARASCRRPPRRS